MSIAKLFAVPALALAASSVLAQSSQKITGTVTDSMCGNKHMMQNASAAQCTRACIKSGANYALMSGGKMYTLKGDTAQIDKFAGAKVEVEGETKGDTVTVKTIKAAS